jgi:SpoVK/Ycf46/Vps4 family AAA+-type ATPase
LDKDVKIAELATLTDGFSGSDIKTLCMQAVLLREPATRHRPAVQKLRREHFQNALKWVKPSVSQPALEEIRAFAAQYDSVVLEELGGKKL